MVLNPREGPSIKDLIKNLSCELVVSGQAWGPAQRELEIAAALVCFSISSRASKSLRTVTRTQAVNLVINIIWNLGTPEFIYEFMKHMNSYMKKSYEYMNSYI